MSNLLRRSWSNRGGTDPTTWELPVNQASKWLVPKSGTNRILGEGGSVTLENNDTRVFLLSVFVGDGGSVTVGGASGANTIQISRTGSTLTMTAQMDSGSPTVRTATTNVASDRWANVYLKATKSGIFNNQITITYLIDFAASGTLIATTANSLTTNGKALACNSLSGWAWFGSTTGGFWGWGGTSTVPITDVKYREAFLNNATWDLDNDTAQHNWSRPDGLRYMRGWAIQAGGGKGGDGGDGAPGQEGQDGSSSQPAGCTDGAAGTAGGPGGDGGPGGNNGAAGQSGSPGGSGGYGTAAQMRYDDNEDPFKVTSCYAGDGGSAGAGGGGGAGGAGGRGVMLLFTLTHATAACRAGAKGAPGQNGTSGSDGGPGGNGEHTTFGGISTASATTLSTPSIKFGATEFVHGLGGSDQDGGTVLYYQW